MQCVQHHEQAVHVNVHVRRVDLICKCASETDDETDMELVDRLWRFLERETRNERKGRGTVSGAWGAWQWSRTNELALQTNIVSRLRDDVWIGRRTVHVEELLRTANDLG